MKAHPVKIPVPASSNASIGTKYTYRTAKWFRKLEHESYYQRAPSLPEIQEEEYYILMRDNIGEDDDTSLEGLSAPEDEDDGVNAYPLLDADQLDEYCVSFVLGKQSWRSILNRAVLYQRNGYFGLFRL